MSDQELKDQNSTDKVEETDQPETEQATEATQGTETAENASAEVVEAKSNEVAEASNEAEPDFTPAEDKIEIEELDTEELISEVAGEDKSSEKHDDFDWTIDKKNVTSYDDSSRKELETLYDSTFVDIQENEIVGGVVVGITKNDVVVNIGFKSDGLVPISEFRDFEDLKIGSATDVYVVDKEDSKGQLVLSRKNAKLLRAWQSIVEAYKNDTVVEGTISSKTKGGLIANVFGLETFLPGSQIDVKPILDYDAFVGQTMEFKVVKVNELIKNAVVSHKALIESDLEEQRQEIISKLEKGQVLEGVIKNITDFGAFIDLGGVDGLLYITDISWGRINHPSEVLQVNEKINVVVLDFDDNKKRISLGLKQLQPHPWDTLTEQIEVGSKVKGKIVNIEDYGAFLEIQPGVEGLIHVSEVSWSNQPINSRDYFKLNEDCEAILMSIDREDRKMALSIKRLTSDPWEQVVQKYPVDSKHTGSVRNITPYGVFIELEEGIGGMVHVSDLSWTKRFGHPSEYTKVGTDLEVVVLEIDNDSRKLTLGHKQIEEDPWDTFEKVFPVGSIHDATILEKESHGAKVMLPYGLEAYAPNRHLKKEDGTVAEVDEKIPFKVIDFNRNDKRITVSHSRVLDEQRRETESSARQKRKSDTERSSKAVRSLNQKMEKTTLGDLGVLGALKSQMEMAEAEPKPKAEKKTPKKEEKKEEPKASTEETPKATDADDASNAGEEKTATEE